MAEAVVRSPKIAFGGDSHSQYMSELIDPDHLTFVLGSSRASTLRHTDQLKQHIIKHPNTTALVFYWEGMT